MPEHKDIASARAKIFKVLYGKSTFEKMTAKQFDKVLIYCNNIICKYLEELGQRFVDMAKMKMLETSPSGKHYMVVSVDDPDTVLHEWDASAPWDAPAVSTGLLMNSIEYRIKYSTGIVEVGVWSDEPWEYHPTKFYKEGVLYYGDGDHVTTVKEYATYLEYGTSKMAPRPFIEPVREEAWIEQRRELQQEIKQAFMQAFGGKVPLTFRIYTRTGY